MHLGRKQSQQKIRLQSSVSCIVSQRFNPSYTLTKVENTNADIWFALIEDHFLCSQHKCIKDTCALQLIDGEGAFRALYNITEDNHTRELVLKTSCCGRNASLSYIAGVHFYRGYWC